MTEARELVAPIIERTQEEEDSVSQWANSLYGPITKFQIDARGKLGVALIASFLTDLGRTVVHNETDNLKDWNLSCDGIKYEIKTATLGKDGSSFQHESIYQTRIYDGLIFVDIAPSAIYISIYAKADIQWDKIHLRKDSAFYKWDTNIKAT
nr:hypothetical protein [Pseudomonadota bacterium]